jgi:hypothetical protein
MQAAAEIYAVATPEGDATILTLYYDEQRETRGGATGMEDVRMNDVPCTKVMENGVLYLMYEGRMYDVRGTRVK